MNAQGHRGSARRRRVAALAALAVLGAATVAGGWAFLEVFLHGHAGEGTTVHVPWGLWVALYLFFLGLSVGAFLVSTLATVFRLERVSEAVPLALVSALGCLILAGLLILVDLGHPERMPLVLTALHPSSPMAWMSVLTSLYGLLLVGQIYVTLRRRLAEWVREGRRPERLYRLLTLGRIGTDARSLERDRRWQRRLAGAGLVAAVALLMTEASIFAVVKARPNWFGGLFPAMVLVSAVASGAALVTFLAAVTLPAGASKTEAVPCLARLTAGVLVFEALLLAGEIVTGLYGDVPHERAAWTLTLQGPFAWLFWGVQVGLGLVVPLVLVGARATRERVAWLGLAGLVAVVGTVGTRVNMIIPAQMVPVLEGLAEAYPHPRFALGYWPAAEEFLVGLGTFALGAWLYLAARRWLPLAAATPANAGEKT